MKLPQWQRDCPQQLPQVYSQGAPPQTPNGLRGSETLPSSSVTKVTCFVRESQYKLDLSGVLFCYILPDAVSL